MLTLHRFIFLSFLVCCFCLNQFGPAGSYRYYEEGSDVAFHLSAFTVTVDEAQTIILPATFNMAKNEDMATYRVPDSEEETYEVFATSYGSVYLYDNSVINKSYYQSDPPNSILVYKKEKKYIYEFYSYKGEIRADFTLIYILDRRYESYAKGEKVSESELKKHIDYTTLVPKYSKYTEFFKVTFDKQYGKVGILSNREEGVIDAVMKHEDGKVDYNPCIWRKEDEIDCNSFRIAFKGEMITYKDVDGSSVSVVSCLVFFISVLVLSLL